MTVTIPVPPNRRNLLSSRKARYTVILPMEDSASKENPCLGELTVTGVYVIAKSRFDRLIMVAPLVCTDDLGLPLGWIKGQDIVDVIDNAPTAPY